MKARRLVSFFLFCSTVLNHPRSTSAEAPVSYVPVEIQMELPDRQGFRSPADVDVAWGRNVLVVVDTGNHVVHIFDTYGKLSATLGGRGSGGGRLRYPGGAVVVPAAGYSPVPQVAIASLTTSVFVADTGNNRIQRLYMDNRLAPQEWGSVGSGNGQFRSPQGIALGPGGQVYVADTGNNRVQVFGSDGVFRLKWGSQGSGDGQFRGPVDLAVDSSGSAYVVDAGNHRVQKFDSQGRFLGKWGSKGARDGQLEGPHGIALDRRGYVYVADSMNSRIQKFNPQGYFQAKWGSQGSGDGQLRAPKGLAVNSVGDVLVADAGNNKIKKFRPIMYSRSAKTFLRKWGMKGSGPGEFGFPGAMAVDMLRNVYVVDRLNNRIIKFDSDGGFLGHLAPNKQGIPGLKFIRGLAIGSSGNIIVGSTDGIISFNSKGELLAKWGVAGRKEGQFWGAPGGIAVDPSGDIYVADIGNKRIQKFNSKGKLLVAWHLPEFDTRRSQPQSGIPDFGTRRFQPQNGIAVDPRIAQPVRSVYVVDTANCRVLNFDSSGGLLAKWGSPGDADGQFRHPHGVAVDLSGNVYVADTGNNRVQKFNSDGAFLAKWGSGGLEDGQFIGPVGIAVDSHGNVYVADAQNHRVQKFRAAE